MPTSRDINAHRNINASPLQTPTNILHLMSRTLHHKMLPTYDAAEVVVLLNGINL